jgi:outer membrane protein
MKMKGLLLAAAMTAVSMIAPANAADLPRKAAYKAPPPVAVWNPWLVRVRALGVLPNASGSSVYVSGASGLSSPNSGLSISNSVVPELDISYFFTKNIAAELVLGVTPHSITGTGALNNINVGHTWLLPPTLTLQYHFTDFGPFQPYVGAGVNYTIMFNQGAGSQVTYLPAAGANVAITSLNVHNAFGAALQAGFDYMIDQHWGVNFDVKKLFLEPTYSATAAVSGGPSLPVTGTANINPWLVGGGVAYKF